MVRSLTLLPCSVIHLFAIALLAEKRSLEAKSLKRRSWCSFFLRTRPILRCIPYKYIGILIKNSSCKISDERIVYDPKTGSNSPLAIYKLFLLYITSQVMKKLFILTLSNAWKNTSTVIRHLDSM